MKRLIAILGAAALASGAGAQGQGGWDFALPGDVGTAANPLRPGQATATVALAAKFDVGPTPGFAGARFSVHASEPGWGDLRLLPIQHGLPYPGPWPDPRGRTPGEIVGADVIGVVHSQLHIGPFVANPSNPIFLWQAKFTVTDFTPREISLSTTTEDFALYPPSGGELIRPAVVEGNGVIYIIPAPGVLALLGLGAMAAARRPR